MIFTTYVSIGWLLAAVFWSIPKRLSFLDHLILWFSCSFVIVSIRTHFTLNLGWLTYSEETSKFITYLLRRSFIDPMLLLLLVNFTLRNKKMIWKLATIIGIIMVYIILEYSLVQLKVITFVKFNYLYVSYMYIFFILFALLVAKLLQRGGTSHEDYNI